MYSITYIIDKDNTINNRVIKYNKNSIYKCIKRHNIKTPLEKAKEENKINKKANKLYNINEPGFINMDFKYLLRIKSKL